MRLFFIILLLGHVSSLAQTRTPDSLQLKSALFGEERLLRVSLPGEYVENAWRKYPLIFLMDGQSEELFNFTRSTIDYLTGNGYMMPVILVAVAHRNRQFELTPAASTAAGKRQFQKSGGAKLFSEHLVKELLPVLTKKYRCSGFRVGIGHSLGGTFVLSSLLSDQSLFNAAVAISPNLEYDSMQIVRAFKLASAGSLDHKFLYLCYGKGDALEDKFRPSSVSLQEVLQKKSFAGLKWSHHAFDHLHHGVTPLNGVPSGLMALFGPLSMSYDQLQELLKDSSKSFISQVKDFYRPLTSWFGQPLPGVHEANTHAYNLFYGGRVKEAIQLLEWAISLHPEDVNLYDSMGEMHQADSNTTAALKDYKNALKLVNRYKNALSPVVYDRQVKWFNERISSVGK